MFEKKTSSIQNFGIVLRYLSRTIIINMYKEYRDVSLSGAIAQMYNEMSSRHRAQHESIQIIKTCVLKPNEVKREASRVFVKSSLKFPKVKPIKRAPKKSLRTTFKATRPKLL